MRTSVSEYSSRRELPSPIITGLLSALAVLLTSTGIAIARNDLNRQWLEQLAPVLGLTMFSIGFLILIHLTQVLARTLKLRRKLIAEGQSIAKSGLHKIELMENELRELDLSEVTIDQKLRIAEQTMRLAESKQMSQAILDRHSQPFLSKLWKKMRRVSDE